MQKKRNSAYAFTLIETIVAIAILTIAVVGPITISGRSIHVSSEARLSTEATYLATEAIEVMRSIRDNASADDIGGVRIPWVLGDAGAGSVHAKCAGGCVIDVTKAGGGSVWNANTIVSCGAGCTNRVYVRATGVGVLYRQDGTALGGQWMPSPFTRVVNTTQLSANLTRVTVAVTYRRTNNTMATITAVDDLYNWFPYLVP